MPPDSYGLVVEGAYDRAVLEEFVRRLTSRQVTLYTRPCNGVPTLMRLFPTFLRDFEQIDQGRPVEKTLVIRDSGGRSPVEVAEEMAQRIAGREFMFPNGVHLCVIHQEMETWMLADEEAWNRVALQRAGRVSPGVQGTLEEITNPKERFKQVLSRSRLIYDPEVCREIAEQIRIEALAYRCPSFRDFQRKVTDC